jgi:hypothetical protein
MLLEMKLETKSPHTFQKTPPGANDTDGHSHQESVRLYSDRVVFGGDTHLRMAREEIVRRYDKG